MVEELTKLKQRFVDLKGVAQKMVRDAFEDLDSVIEDMNISQLEQGTRSDGEKLPDYSPRSVEEFGKPPGAIRLKDTGDFHKGITLTVATDAATLFGRDSKTEQLEFEYGEEIIGLTERNQEELKNVYITPLLQEAFLKHFE